MKSSAAIGLTGVVLLLASACSSGPDQPQPLANQPPTIAGLASKSFDQGMTDSVSFTVGDDASPPADLRVTVSVTNTALLPPESLRIEGNGPTRQVLLAPEVNSTGESDLTVTVTDPAGRETSRTVRINVRPVFSPVSALADDAFARELTDTPLAVNGSTFQQDVEDPTAYDALLASPEP